jgi:hypothetical protein
MAAFAEGVKEHRDLSRDPQKLRNTFASLASELEAVKRC